jgi:hypothetical protein
MTSDSNKYIDRLTMPASAVEAMTRAVPDDLMRVLCATIARAQHRHRLRQSRWWISWGKSLNPRRPIKLGYYRLHRGCIHNWTTEGASAGAMKSQAP